MTSNFYKDLMDPAIENNSDVSEIGPEDLENIVKGVDDIDDALFGFKTKQQDPQKNTTPAVGGKQPERPKSAIKKQSNVSGFPEEDLLADISLSDDDFYDLGKKSSSTSTKQDKLSTTPLKTPSQDKLTKSKKIANLFGLDDEDEVVIENKKKPRGAADWLGIKDSPVKTLTKTVAEENLGFQTPKQALTESSTVEDPFKTSLPEVKITPARSTASKETEISIASTKTSQSDKKPFDSTKTKPAKSGENFFDLLGEKNEQQKSIENPKDKKSAIFDELFGDSVVNQKSKSRRNSAVKTPDTTIIEPAVSQDVPSAALQDDSSTTLGQYIPSAATSKRPGVGRRRETTPSLLTSQASLPLFQEDWLKSPDSQLPEPKKETTKPVKADAKPSGIEVHDSLPTWLGGSGITLDIKQDLKQPAKALEKKVEKPAPVTQPRVAEKTAEPEKHPAKDPGVQAVDTIREALATSSEQSHQTALALQRTEAQLLAALQLQTTQNGLSAVCARQRSLLDNQEKQLTQMVARQTDRQEQLEKQLTAQQLRIQQLMEVLAENITGSKTEVFTQHEPIGTSTNDNEQKEEIIKEFEREVQKLTLENEELRLRMVLMEKHYKMEYESLHIQHQREIESWEEKMTMQREILNHQCEDYKERISRLKENQAELLAQHNERVQRLREEKAEDIKQLMDFHKTTLEQMMVISKLIPPTVVREEQKTSFQTWKPLDASQLSEKEEDILKKESMLKGLQEKLEAQKKDLEKRAEEIENKEEQEKLKFEDMSQQITHEKNQLKYQQLQFQQEKKRMEEQYHEQRKQLEEMQERILSEQTQLTTEKLKLAEERAKLEALAKLQGVSGTATFDALKSKAEVHGALEAARSAKQQAVQESLKLREKENFLDSERRRLKEREDQLNAHAEHLDHLLQVSEAKQQAGQKALEEAKLVEKRAEEKLIEAERWRMELREKEKDLIKMKLNIAHDEMRLNRKREQLEHILPRLSSDEAITLQPIKDVIDPKKLIMKLRAEREFEASCKSQQPGKESSHQ